LCKYGGDHHGGIFTPTRAQLASDTTISLLIGLARPAVPAVFSCFRKLGSY
jgi:hypothetical protein